MSFNAKTKPAYLRCKTPIDIKIKRKSDNRSRSVIAACTFDGIFAYKMFEGSVNAQRFGSFMVELLQEVSKDYINLKDVIVVLDNAKTHNATILGDLKAKIYFHYLPAYRPDLNLIERVFSSWKYNIKKLMFEKECPNYEDIAYKAASSISVKGYNLKLVDQLNHYLDTVREAKSIADDV